MSRKTRPGPHSSATREPTIRELRKEFARTGDVDAIWAELTTRPWTMIDQEELFAHLLRAIEVRSRRDPEAFAADAFARMIGLVSYLTLRGHHYIGHRIARHGRGTRDGGPSDFPPDVTDKLIPRVMDLQGHLTELIQAQATTARSWALARAKRAENGRAAGGDGQAGEVPGALRAPASANGHARPPEAPDAKPRKASAKDRSNGKSNGHQEPVTLDVGPVNRIGRYLDGNGTGSNGAGHDG